MLLKAIHQPNICILFNRTVPISHSGFDDDAAVYFWSVSGDPPTSKSTSPFDCVGVKFSKSGIHYGGTLRFSRCYHAY